MQSKILRAASASFVVAIASCSVDRPNTEPLPEVTPASSVVRASVAHRNGVGAPSFAWITRTGLPHFETAREAATATLEGIAPTFGLSREAMEATTITEIDEASGPAVVRFKQHIGEVEVFRGGLSVILDKDHAPVAASGFLAPTLDGSSRRFERDRIEALDVAEGVLGRRGTSFTSIDSDGGYERFSASHLRLPARTKKVLYPTAQKTLEPAYYVELIERRGGAWAFVVSAITNAVLLRADLVHNEAFTYRVWASPQTLVPMDGPQGNGAIPHPTGRPDGFKPTFIPQESVTLQNFPFSNNDPWLPPNATKTSGNNVDAYADVVAPDGLDPSFGDITAVTTGARAFEHVYDTSLSPGATPEQMQASVTQLFYLMNFLHDWFYDSGFDEKAGNNQSNNFARGGKAQDPVLAESQDYSGRNNANAAVPPDGQSARIQMFVFSGPSDAALDVTAPPEAAGTKTVGIAQGFGLDSFDLTADVVLALDGGGTDPSDACEPLGDDVNGKIVLIHRGTCSFAQKAQNVQSAGGVGAIIANVMSSASPGTAPFMGGTQAGIGIPVLSLNVTDGVALEAAVRAGATSVRMRRALQRDLDGALDTTIAAHEWGHILSNRLVGDGLGLLKNQSGGLGEGWSDFVALLLTAREDDLVSPMGASWNGVYGNGPYVASGSGDDVYFGLRRVPYSTDFTKNALTFRHIQNGQTLPSNVPTSFGEDGSFNAEVHNTGEVWATMLWECYVALLRDPRFTFRQAQDRMKRYLVAGLKLTPVDPTLLEARDALLSATLAADPKDFELFYKAFARRGAGVGATGPDKDSSDNGPVKESFLVGNGVQIVSAKLTDDTLTCDHDGVLDDGEVGTLIVELRNDGIGPLTSTRVELASTTPGVIFPDGDKITLTEVKPFETGVVKARAVVRGTNEPTNVNVDVAVTDPTFVAEPNVVQVRVPTRVNTDEVPESSRVDTVDTTRTAWRVTGDDSFGTTKKWSRAVEGLNGFWSIPNGAEPSEHMLTSPKFTVDPQTNAFTLSFKHRFSFRGSSRRRVDLDGGIIEVSVDGGKTWRDITSYSKNADYNSTLDAQRNDNPFAGEKAYGGVSPAYPKFQQSRIDIQLKSTPETVQIRFHLATGFDRLGAGAPGWDIDDISLEGITSQPFWSFQRHADACDENGPTANAGPGRTVTGGTVVTLAGSGSHPNGLPINYRWMQETGPGVKLEADTTATPTFVAPAVTEPTPMTLVLRTDDGKLISSASRVQILVTNDGGMLEGGGCGCREAPGSTNGTSSRFAAGGSALLALSLLAARRRRR